MKYYSVGNDDVTSTLVVEGTVHEITIEDYCQAKIATIDDNAEVGLFVVVHSWTDHTTFDDLIQAGSRYRVTIERLPQN